MTSTTFAHNRVVHKLSGRSMGIRGDAEDLQLDRPQIFRKIHTTITRLAAPLEKLHVRWQEISAIGSHQKT
jgi:hypothetical protein